VRFARSFRNEMGLSFGAVILRFSAARRSFFTANYHLRFTPANASQPTWFALWRCVSSNLPLVGRAGVALATPGWGVFPDAGSSVIPAKAGIQGGYAPSLSPWIPAFAGMTH
jgi:hypothetical protein